MINTNEVLFIMRNNDGDVWTETKQAVGMEEMLWDDMVKQLFLSEADNGCERYELDITMVVNMKLYMVGRLEQELEMMGLLEYEAA